jgi:hypothetical protein
MPRERVQQQCVLIKSKFGLLEKVPAAPDNLRIINPGETEPLPTVSGNARFFRFGLEGYERIPPVLGA